MVIWTRQVKPIISQSKLHFLFILPQSFLGQKIQIFVELNFMFRFDVNHETLLLKLLEYVTHLVKEQLNQLLF